MAAGGEARPASYIRTVYVEYTDTPAGHFEFGRSVGEAVGDAIRAAWASDKELAAMEEWAATDATGRRVFESFVQGSNASFPLYTREVEGMAVGSQVPLRRLLVNQLREELSQFLPETVGWRKRRGKCTDAFAYDPSSGVAAWGHNDDWSVNWRNASYMVLATALAEDGSVKLKFGSWFYPGYLPGMDIAFNSHGVAYTVNSLFPRAFHSSGVGTAWVARHLLEATSMEDAVARAADARVSTAMSYNIGDVRGKRMAQLEADSRGRHGLWHVTGPYFHANLFRHLETPQFSEASSDHRTARWEQLRPSTVEGLRQFLSDTQDPEWPVYRNARAPDDCYTEVTGLFDLERGTLSVWNSPAAASPPLATFDLSFGAAAEAGAAQLVYA